MTRTAFDVDAIQALLDMLTGWEHFVAERIDDPDSPEYSERYLDVVFDLRQKVAELVWTDESTLTPHEFIEQHVLPLFLQKSPLQS